MAQKWGANFWLNENEKNSLESLLQKKEAQITEKSNQFDLVNQQLSLIKGSTSFKYSTLILKVLKKLLILRKNTKKLKKSC